MPSHSSAFRTYFRTKLNSLLEIADDEGFIQLLWAANALQAGAEEAAAPHLAHSYPPAAVTTDLTDKTFIYKWEFETLANEILAVAKRSGPKRGKDRALIVNNYENIVRAVNLLRKLENSEGARGLNNTSIFREMARIANRQFDWQRGYFNVPQFYRNAFVYGQGACAAFFEAEHGITINQLSLVGFGIHTALTHDPVFNRRADLTQLGVSADDLGRALTLIAGPIDNMRIQGFLVVGY